MNRQFRLRLRLKVSEAINAVASSEVTQPGAEAVKVRKVLGNFRPNVMSDQPLA
jgi:hypothetical protein